MFGQDNQHILIIEDDTAVAQSLRKGLEEEGFKVSWRKEGWAGIELAVAERPTIPAAAWDWGWLRQLWITTVVM